MKLNLFQMLVNPTRNIRFANVLCGEDNDFDEDQEDEDEFYCRNWCQFLTVSEQREKNENK